MPSVRWQLSLSLDPAQKLPLFVQLARGISEAIRKGVLKPGAELPSSRALARTLLVHRNTVLAAYGELSAEGWIESVRAKGTFVSRSLPDARPVRFSPGRAKSGKEPGFDFEPVAAREEVHSISSVLAMSGGVPDLRLLPVTQLARAYRHSLQKHGHVLLNYGDPRGHPRLREALAAMLRSTRGLAVDADDVLVTRGSQMALDLVARTLCRRGERIAVESFGYRPAWESLTNAGATLVPIPVDREGLRLDVLETVAKRRKLRAIYLTPHHQYPTTVTLTASRRLALLELARKSKIAIIEDDYDHEFHYQGRPILPLASADAHGFVLYIGTLSKILAPGLRLGYLVAPRRFLEQATAVRCAVDRQGDQAVEFAVAELLEDGEVQRHVQRMRRVYHARRDHLVRLLEKKLPSVFELEMPQGGMALWTKVNRGIDVEAWALRAEKNHLIIHTAKRFAFDRRARPFLRLGFASLDEQELDKAIGKLAASI